METTLLVDGHVHYHPCFDLREFLDAASANFRAAREEVGEERALGCLMLTESSWSHWFRELAGGRVVREGNGWTVETTGEDCSVFARRNGGERILLVAGRQIVTRDRLEVLALATAEEYPDGLPVGEAIDRALESGASVVLPWGFGKWTGARARTVTEILSSRVADQMYVGDNGGRPAVGLEPALFRLARDRGVPILPGSDPLPLPPEVRKPGRFGFVLAGPFSDVAPAAAIRDLLATRRQPRPFGRLERLGAFVHRQVALRLRRSGRPAAAAGAAGGASA